MSDRPATRPFSALRFDSGRTTEVQDLLAVETPLQVKINGVSYTTTLRTPGEDEFLVRGLLHTESIIPSIKAPIRFRVETCPETEIAICVDVIVPPTLVAKPVEGRRSIASTSSCGLCGTRDLADVLVCGPPLRINDDGPFPMALLPDMLAAMRSSQSLFSKSGGCHAAAVFDHEGDMLAAFEDVGRHNAVDKVIGRLITEHRLDQARRLLVSGRISYEIVLKAYKASVPIVAAVSAPSSLAVEAAEGFGITVIGFCREGRGTVYSHPENVASAQAESSVNFPSPQRAEVNRA